MMSTRATHELLEIGVISPEPEPSAGLGVGEVGYLITGVKDVRQSRVGDTVTNMSKPAKASLGGYRDPKPMVFSGLYPIDGSDYPALRDALDKLKLNDAALVYEPETSAALGFGFRVGFLGMLHLEIVRERLEREFNLDLISTLPNVEYDVRMEDGSLVDVTNPASSPRARWPRCVSQWCGPPSLLRASSSGRSWSCASSAAAPCAAWTTSAPSGSRCATPCRSPRSSSTSSTS